MESGIYCILNLKNNKRYIGQSKDLEMRKNKNLRSLRDNNHYNKHLQRDFNSDGEENFEFVILEKCSIDELDSRELHYIQKFETMNKDKGYNNLSLE